VSVEGYFEETKLPRIHVDDAVDVRLMGGAVLAGQVESIAGGIEDRDRSSGASLLASVNPTFSWVRLAQRIPVRIRIKSEDREGLVVGMTATVQVRDQRMRSKQSASFDIRSLIGEQL
jgi:multidrug resistance efflux pump